MSSVSQPGLLCHLVPLWFQGYTQPQGAEGRVGAVARCSLWGRGWWTWAPERLRQPAGETAGAGAQAQPRRQGGARGRSRGQWPEQGQRAQQKPPACPPTQAGISSRSVHVQVWEWPQRGRGGGEGAPEPGWHRPGGGPGGMSRGWSAPSMLHTLSPRRPPGGAGHKAPELPKGSRTRVRWYASEQRRGEQGAGGGVQGPWRS